jgi:hypothetical protein
MSEHPNRRSHLVALCAVIALVTSSLLVGSAGAATASAARQSSSVGCGTSIPTGVGSSSCPDHAPAVPARRPFLVSSGPTVTGTARIGYTLTAHVAAWSPTPTSLSYQWYVSDSIIPGATTSSYPLTIDVFDTEITVRIVGRYPTYATTTYTSRPVVVGPGVFGSAPTPTISGVAHVNTELTANTGTWSPTPDALGYQWKSNGIAIPGETSSSYDVSPNQVGHRISVSVTGTRFDYDPTTKTSASTAAIVVPIPIPKDGTYRVGVNLAPGTYVTTGATDECYWERDSDFSGSFDSIIANHLAPGEAIVTIAPTDAKFLSDRCGKWERLEDAPSPLRTSFGAGVYAVGQQIEPGTYQASSGSECYWATLAGFSDEDLPVAFGGDLIDNDLGGSTVVEISGAVGFETDDCGTWTRIGP